MAAVRMDAEPPPVSSLLPVLATAPRLMVYGLCGTALSVAGEVLKGIDQVFEKKKREAEGGSRDRNREGAGHWKAG